MNHTLKPIEPKQYKAIYKRIQSDFAAGEYAPYFVLSHQMREGVQQGVLLLDGEQEVAYAIYAVSETRRYALISLFAVYREHRALGYGSAFLRELIASFDGLAAVYVEVEKPECAKNETERRTRQRRIRFYESAGFVVVPGVDYSIWDVPMHLMTLPISATVDEAFARTGEAMHVLYLKLMGNKFIHKMKFNRRD